MKTRRFARDEAGSATIESVMWVAFLVALMGLMVDLSLMLMNQADMWNIASDTSRQLAIGAITTADASAYANEQSIRGSGYTVNVKQSGDMITTNVSIPLSNVSISSWFVDSGATMGVSVAQRVEP